ncbi:hypothetical protein PFISCL1PPCAC_21993, partial [Pristionchus fissidentatus]
LFGTISTVTMSSPEDRKERMTNIVKCIDALSKVENSPICRASTLMAKIVMNLEDTDGMAVDDSLVRSLASHVNGDHHSNIDGMAVNHMAKLFLHFLEGVSSRSAVLSLPSVAALRPLPPLFFSMDEGKNENGEMSLDELPGTSGGEGGRRPKVESPSEMDLLLGLGMGSDSLPFTLPSTSRRSPSREEESEPSAVKRIRLERAMRETDSMSARTCPYCGRVFTSYLEVESHATAAHPSERSEVYGCSDCGLSCVSVKTLLTHWDKHRDCPRGRLVVRTPNEAAEIRGDQEKKPIFACGSCEKKFVSRIGVKYHVKNVCKGAEIIKLPPREPGGYGNEWNEIDPGSVRSNESDS